MSLQPKQIPIAVIAMTVAFWVPPAAAADLGTYERWSRIEIDFAGPPSTAAGDPNPFDVLLDVTFTAPGGARTTVPGFYDGDGAGGPDGDVWRVRFSADTDGAWSFVTSSARPELDGISGTFTVVSPSGSAPDFYRWGRLEAVGTPADSLRYLKFRDGPFWLKAGCDDPENFLGDDFETYDTDAERLAAIDFLADRGINSMYMLTHNIGGDNNDVWPWLGATPSAAMANAAGEVRFDIPRLHSWLMLFETMQVRGVVPYLILEDDSAWNGYDHARYYRELVARFGHMPALLFNLGEEATENYSVSEALSHLQTLADIDPYDHPRAIHNINYPLDQYIDAEQADFTAIQTFGGDPTNHNQQTLDWIQACKTRGERVLVVGYDEPRPLLDRKAWWSAYLAGGVWEAHVISPYDRPLSTWEPAFTELGGTRAFMETLPFHEMEAANSVVTSGAGFCLAKPGEVYAFYLPAGGSVTVDLPAGFEFDVDWWDPANGQDGSFVPGGAVSGGSVVLTAPGGGDWAARVVRSGGGGNVAPVASDGSLSLETGTTRSFTLAWTDPDGPSPGDVQIVSPVSAGTLSGSGSDWSYTAPSTAGTHAFEWEVFDGIDTSNVATFTFDVVDPAVNSAPAAINQQVTAFPGATVDVPLVYSDPDGPGPYSFAIVQPPQNGTVTVPDAGSNDVIYQPDPGFTGVDSFGWTVDDGLQTSLPGTVEVHVASVVFADDFERPDSGALGGSWEEYELGGDAVIAAGTLRFDAADHALRPLVSHTFPRQTSGQLEWTFELGFQRSGPENTYAFHMQLGDSATMDPADPDRRGVAVNLLWGGPGDGLSGHELLAAWTPAGTVEFMPVSGANTVTVQVDLDQQTFDIQVGGSTFTGVTFDDATAIDTVRFFADRLASTNFSKRFVDDVEIRGAGPAFNDGDGDGIVDADDCMPGSSTVWAAPGPVGELTLAGASGTTLSWTPPSAPGGSAVAYDVLRGVDPSSVAGAVCVVSDTSEQSWADPSIPAGLYFYLVRARNECGAAIAHATAGSRQATVCP